MRLEDAVDVELGRFDSNPLVTPDSDERIGSNINGPSVVRAPDWIDDPLGRYYMYFAHHSGEFIRLAYADDLRGPWTVHSPGVLDLERTQFEHHIASPDVHVDDDEGRVRLYFHGCCGSFEYAGDTWSQVTHVATSEDGLDFTARGETLGLFYFRVWEHEGAYYAVANDGHLYRGENPLEPFERLQELFPTNRHFAVRFLDDDTLQLFLTRRGDRPERVMATVIDLSPPAEEWRADPHPPETVLWPATEYEGGDLPIESSESGSVDEPVRALRDPAVYDGEEGTFLFYSIAGERGIAGAEILD